METYGQNLVCQGVEVKELTPTPHLPQIFSCPPLDNRRSISIFQQRIVSREEVPIARNQLVVPYRHGWAVKVGDNMKLTSLHRFRAAAVATAERTAQKEHSRVVVKANHR